MLLAIEAMDLLSELYIDPHHPLQVLMRSTLAEFAGIAAEEIPISIDGCGVPAFHLSLYRAAYAYARLMATSSGAGAGGALDRYAASAHQVVESMTTFPYFVAGNWSITTPLMQAFTGDLLAKEGAEGFYAMALSPGLREALTDRLKLDDDCAVGIALKIHDGSMTRGRNPVILRTLELLGLDAGAAPELQQYRTWPVRNVAGTLVGDVRAEFELEML
jgi:L-asparaginase II